MHSPVAQRCGECIEARECLARLLGAVRYPRTGSALRGENRNYNQVSSRPLDVTRRRLEDTFRLCLSLSRNAVNRALVIVATVLITLSETRVVRYEFHIGEENMKNLAG